MRVHDFRNKHTGQRCFVHATGPSIQRTNTLLLDGETVFAVNSSYNNVNLKPTYYVVSDPRVMRSCGSKVLDYCKDRYLPLFLCDYAASGDNVMVANNLYRDATLSPQVSLRQEFGDVTRLYCYGSTVVHIVLQLAFFMNFDEVYLLGCDCDYSGEHHFDGTKSDDWLQDRGKKFAKSHWETVFQGYINLKWFFDRHGKRIYNATVGGQLEVFERISLEDLFNNKIQSLQ